LTQILKMHQDNEPIIAHNAIVNFEATKNYVIKSSKARSEQSSQNESAHEESQEAEEISLNSNALETEATTAHFNTILGTEMSQKIDKLRSRWVAERIMYFCFYAARGDIKQINRILSSGISVNAEDGNKRTPLHVAASEGQMEVVTHLLECGANPHLKDSSGHNALTAAVVAKRDELAQLLLNHDPNMRLSLPESTCAVMLCYAAFEQDLDQIKRFLRFGMSVNAADYDQRTPLHIAASVGSLETVELLLEWKAEINATDRFGSSPLLDAVRHRNKNVCECLLRHGGELLGSNVGVMLCEAAAIGDVEELQFLITNGADPNVGDYDRRTALHLASSNGQVPVLNYLLSIQPPIEVNARDRMMGTPLDDAYRHKEDVAQTMLIKAGAMKGSDPRMSEYFRIQEAKTHKKEKVMRVTSVQNLVEASGEAKAYVWMKGRFGKLAISSLRRLNSVATELKETWEQGICSQELRKRTAVQSMTQLTDSSPRALTKHRKSKATHDRAKASIATGLNPLMQAADDWLVMLQELQELLAEQEPQGQIMKWASIKFRPAKMQLQTEILQAVALCKKLKQLAGDLRRQVQSGSIHHHSHRKKSVAIAAKSPGRHSNANSSGQNPLLGSPGRDGDRGMQSPLRGSPDLRAPPRNDSSECKTPNAVTIVESESRH